MSLNSIFIPSHGKVFLSPNRRKWKWEPGKKKKGKEDNFPLFFSLMRERSLRVDGAEHWPQELFFPPSFFHRPQFRDGLWSVSLALSAWTSALLERKVSRKKVREDMYWRRRGCCKFVLNFFFAGYDVWWYLSLFGVGRRVFSPAIEAF